MVFVVFGVFSFIQNMFGSYGKWFTQNSVSYINYSIFFCLFFLGKTRACRLHSIPSVRSSSRRVHFDCLMVCTKHTRYTEFTEKYFCTQFYWFLLKYKIQTKLNNITYKNGSSIIWFQDVLVSVWFLLFRSYQYEIEIQSWRQSIQSYFIVVMDGNWIEVQS